MLFGFVNTIEFTMASLQLVLFIGAISKSIFQFDPRLKNRYKVDLRHWTKSKVIIPRNVVKFALDSDLCQFDSFRPKINMGGDREVVVIIQLSICTLHTMFVNPIRVKP